MNIHEAALDYERKLITDASSGRDNPFNRVGVRSDSYDDCGEPLCSEPEPETRRASLAGSFLSIVRCQHHLNTEGV